MATIERTRTFFLAGLTGLMVLACQPVVINQAGQECAPASGGEQGTPDELSELMAELIAPRICEQVVGAFIGLPGDEGHEGPAAGTDPAVGRWWVRRCSAQVNGGRLRVAIGGPGWTWLDRESLGFRVRQYLRFEADATFSASLHVGYDSRTRIASIWLRPAPGVAAHVEPTGLVQAEATGVFSSLLGGILDMTGSSANDRARQQAADEGSQRLTDRFATGFTVTYQLDSEQMDFMLGELSRGQTPERPWPTGSRWLINERAAVWPGGVDVIGPMSADAGPVTLSAELEEGDGATVRRVCEDELHGWLDAAWNGQAQHPPRGDGGIELTALRAPSRVELSASDCRAVLLVTPPPRSTLPLMLRVHVVPTSSEGAQTTDVSGVRVGNGDTGASVGVGASVGAGSAEGGTRVGSASPGAPSAVRVRIVSLSVAARTGSGGAWDMLGGEPDPYVVVSSIADGRELHRTDVADDTREVQLDVALPGAVRLAQFPLRLVVYDDDVAGDEVVGSADVEASALRRGQVDLSLDLRTQGGGSPARTGVIRVRLESVD